MGSKEQGRVRTGGGAEEERVGGRGHLLPEEGEPQNHLHERTAQDRARPTGGAATAAQEGEGLQSAAVQGCIRWGGGGAVWQNVGERRYTEKQKPRMVDGRGGEGSGGEAGSMEDGRRHYKQRGATIHRGLKHLYGQKKAANRAVDRARRSMEEELPKAVAKR